MARAALGGGRREEGGEPRWGAGEEAGAASPVRVLPAAPGQRSELLPGRARGGGGGGGRGGSRGWEAEAAAAARAGSRAERKERPTPAPRSRAPRPSPAQPVPGHARRPLSPGASRCALRPSRRAALGGD